MTAHPPILKPCPFTGKPVEEYTEHGMYGVSCPNHSCPCQMIQYVSRRDLIRLWNTRAHPSPESSLVETLTKASYHKPGSNTRGLDLDEAIAIVRQHYTNSPVSIHSAEDVNKPVAPDVVERVAEALHRYDDTGYAWFERAASDKGRVIQQKYRRKAKAAIAAMQEHQNSGILEHAAIAGEYGHGPEGCDTLPARESAPATTQHSHGWLLTLSGDGPNKTLLAIRKPTKNYRDKIDILVCLTDEELVSLSQQAADNVKMRRLQQNSGSDPDREAYAGLESVAAIAGESRFATIATEVGSEIIPPSPPAPRPLTEEEKREAVETMAKVFDDPWIEMPPCPYNETEVRMGESFAAMLEHFEVRRKP